MQIVNGYPCVNCSDTELAKRGVDPAKGVAKTRLEEAAAAAAAKKQAVTARADAPLAAGPRGRAVNLLT